MTTLPAYLADKNSLAFRGYKMCIEFLYDNSDPLPVNWLYYRKARYDADIVITIDQLGNPGTNVTATFAGGSPIGDVEETQNTQDAATTMQLILPNAARELQSICEFYDLSEKLGRLLWVHPDHLADGPVVESVFEIQSAAPVRDHGVITVTPYSFDPTLKMIPAEVVTSDRWPGIAGVRARYLV
jgi:hypothetical protein